MATIRPNAGLAAGNYTGQIAFHACADSACNQHIGGTPVYVNFSIHIRQSVATTPAIVSVTAESGTFPVVALTVQPGEGESGFSVSIPPADWVQVQGVTASGLQLAIHSLPVGTWTTSVVLRGSAGSTVQVPISFVSTPPPGGQQAISTTPANLQFVASEGAAAPTQQLTVNQSTWLPGLAVPNIEYPTGLPTGWLSVVASPGGYSVTADAASLSAGAYYATVHVWEQPAPSTVPPIYPSAQHTDVYTALTVGPGLVAVPDIAKVVDAETSAAQLGGSVPIVLASGGAANWTASSDSPWLTVTSAGTTSGTLSYAIDLAWLMAAENFREYPATITVSVPGSSITPLAIKMRVTPAWPEVTGIGPAVIPAGAPGRITVTGRGYGAVTNLLQRVSVSGATVAGVTRVSDRKLYVDLTAPAAGTHTVSLSNAASGATAARAIVAHAPAASAYTAITLAGYKSQLLLDERRDTVYVLLYDTGTLQRLRNVGGTWQVDVVPVADVNGAAIIHDGSLLVASGRATMQRLDGDNFTALASATYDCLQRRENYPWSGMVIDDRDRAWIANDATSASCTAPLSARVATIDPATLTLTTWRDAQGYPLSPVEGMASAISRDGERLVGGPLDQTYIRSYMDISDGTWQYSGDVGGAAFTALSNDGGRMLTSFYGVLDAQFGIVGKITTPAYGTPSSLSTALATAIAPAGDRAYAMSVRNDDVNQPVAGNLPRVYVYDTTNALGDVPLPILGYFEIADYPTCINDTIVCNTRPQAAVSMDGTILFLAGQDKVLIVPIPATLTPAATRKPGAAAVGKVWRWGAVH